MHNMVFLLGLLAVNYCVLYSFNTSERSDIVHFEINAVKYGENDLCRKVSL